jgi:hypothetical protein
MAAGLGFKTFTTGEVLTAADVNGYLMQGVLVFASEAARNAAITSPQEGQFAFTKDNNSLWYYTGSAWAASGATGDIEGVTVSSPITGGGTSGTVNIAYDYAAGSKVTLNAQTASYTVVLTDADQKLITMSVASANDFSIPTNANVAFTTGTVINVIQIGAGQTTIKAVTSGTTTVLSTGATAAQPKLRAQYSAASCIKVATDTWYVVGDIA